MLLVVILCIMSFGCAPEFWEGVGNGLSNSQTPGKRRALAAGVYDVTLKRIDTNLYRDNISGILIKTKYCYEYCYAERATLIWRPYSYDSKLIIRDQSYDVEAVWK